MKSVSSNPKSPENNSVQIHSVNVKEIQKQKSGKADRDNQEKTTLDKPLVWSGIGIAISIPFIVVGFFQKEFFYLSALGPIIGILGWLIHKIIKKHNLDIAKD